MIIPKQIAGLLAKHAKQSRAVKVSPQGLALVQQFHDYQIEFRPARGVFGAETSWLSPLALPILKMGGDVQLINGGGRWSCEIAPEQPGGKPRKTSARVALPPGEVSQIMRDGRGGVRYGLDPVALLGALTSADKIAPGATTNSVSFGSIAARYWPPIATPPRRARGAGTAMLSRRP